MPGALPVPNRAAIESIVLAGLATNCDIEKHSMFYRKTYMYPDMSKNYQTTQGPVAFCMRGHLDLDVDGAAAKERADLDGLAVGESRGNAVSYTHLIAAQIIAETPVIPKAIAKANTGSRTLNVVLLVVFSPIWVPVALALVMAALMVYLSIWMVVVALWATVATLLLLSLIHICRTSWCRAWSARRGSRGR